MSRDLLDTVRGLARPLDERTWRTVNQRYLARAIGELLHESMIDAEVDAAAGGARIAIAGDDPGVHWTCIAHRRALHHWHVEPASIRREAGGRVETADAAPACPSCGSLDVALDGGDEVVLEWLRYAGPAPLDRSAEPVPAHTHPEG